MRKAGPKDNKRKWPLGEEYYAFINPYMLAALTELVEDFDILSSYKPVIARCWMIRIRKEPLF